MNRVYFAIGLHFHQPVGNFEKILERAYQNCYKPFLEVFTKYPDIKMTLHISGNLLDYFEERYPEFLDSINGLVFSGQVEIMSGGYYEPIFQAIPQQDRIGQIKMLSDYVERRFNIRPSGMWTPERVWSPDFIQDFCACGIKYSILDDAHLIKAGVNKDNLYGYFMTGSGDNKMAIFPSDKALRYLIPFRLPCDTIDYFKRVARKTIEPLFVYGDDGEKFGEWPWTYDWVYKKDWLNNFFKELMKAGDWIKTVTFSEYLDSHQPLKEIAIPEASYEEMLEWSEGSWMNFLSRYPESDQMHKRMRYVSERISEAEIRNPKSEIRKSIEKAKKELYKGQTNCPYWHGVFGGIYLYHLRSAVYEHLINADRAIDGIEHSAQDSWIKVRELDFYKNGDDEGEGAKAMIMESGSFFICADPANSGSIKELDYKPKATNLINTLTRRKELYHKKILERINNEIRKPVAIHEAIKTMDTRIKDGIFYDKHARACLVDHFISKDLTRDDFMRCNYTDKGDFAGSSYIARTDKERIILSRDGMVKGKALLLTKEIGISSDTEIIISYLLKNKSDSTLNTLFGMEFNVTMPYADSDMYNYEANGINLGALDKAGSASESDSFLIKDSCDELGIEFMFNDRPKSVWYFPVRTVSQSESAYDLNYQSSCIFPIWNVSLSSGGELRLDIKWGMK
ncbi:alpha-amylase/4-alpha-glucanotransferase domain-containing protein [Candidatus Omnitrophota bacterium]